jgi:hypothetical protein
MRLHDRILKPREPDIATSLGAAQAGLAQSLVQRPIGAPVLIASKSYVIGIAANRAKRARGTRPSGNATKMNDPDGIFEYVLDLDNCACRVTSLMNSLCLQERVIW